MSDLKAFKRWEEHRIENLRQLHSANGAQHILECYAEIDRLTTAPAKVEGAAMTPDLIEHARKWAFNYDYALKDALCDLAHRGLDAGTRVEWRPIETCPKDTEVLLDLRIDVKGVQRETGFLDDWHSPDEGIEAIGWYPLPSPPLKKGA